MVFTSWSLMARIAKHSNQFFGRPTIHPDKYWSRRRMKMMTAHFYGRSRNCYKLALRFNISAFKTAMKLRHNKKKDAITLWDSRIQGVSDTLNYDSWYMREALARSGVYLDRHVISTLGLTEPRSMRCLVSIAAQKTSQAGREGGLGVVGAGPGPDIKTVGTL